MTCGWSMMLGNCVVYDEVLKRVQNDVRLVNNVGKLCCV